MPDRPAISRTHATALAAYARLPRFLRIWLVRRIAPGHTVGALALIEHSGRLLMLRQRHRTGWTFPGGLLNRGEDAATAVVREVLEETGLRIEVRLPFTVVVEPSSRRVDVLFWVPADQGSGPAPDVEAAGEALSAGWLPPDDDVEAFDEPTTRALAEFRRFRGGDPHAGRLLGTS
jgi:8-oxo-dGTP pyrophosphatase MutT (NUDIX family)